MSQEKQTNNKEAHKERQKRQDDTEGIDESKKETNLDKKE